MPLARAPPFRTADGSERLRAPPVTKRAPPMSLIPCAPPLLPASSRLLRQLQLLAALARERATTLEGRAFGEGARAGSRATIATVLAERAAFLFLPLPFPLDVGAAAVAGGGAFSAAAAVERAFVSLAVL